MTSIGVSHTSLGNLPLCAYAVVLDQAKFAIFDGRDVPDVDAAIQRAPMFYVSVMDNAVKTGRWPVVGTAGERLSELHAPPTFMQDPIQPDRFQIYDRGMLSPATRDECLRLDRTAVWSAEHVEERVRDVYASRKNSWLESMLIDAI